MTSGLQGRQSPSAAVTSQEQSVAPGMMVKGTLGSDPPLPHGFWVQALINTSDDRTACVSSSTLCISGGVTTHTTSLVESLITLGSATSSISSPLFHTGLKDLHRLVSVVLSSGKYLLKTFSLKSVF